MNVEILRKLEKAVNKYRLGTDDKIKLDNLSPLLFDFLKSKDHIFMLTTGTGRGKSHSINLFNAKSMEIKEIQTLLNKIIYVTDRKENIRAEHEDFQKFLGDFKIDPLSCIRVLSNLDCVTEHFESFEELGSFPNLFSRTNDITKIDRASYDTLFQLCNDYMSATTRNNVPQKILDRMYDDLRRAEVDFRLSIRIMLRQDNKFNACKNNEEKIHYMESRNDYRKILEVYTNIYAMIRPMIFVTLQKGKNIFDSIIDSHYEILGAKVFLENSVVILDESDALRESMLDIEAARQAKYDTDIIAYTQLFADSIERRMKDIDGAVRVDENVMAALDEWRTCIMSLDKVYRLICPIKTEENLTSNWMFMYDDNPIGASELQRMFVQHDDEENITYVTKNDCGEDLSFANFSLDLNKSFNQVIKLLKLASDVYYSAHQDENLTQRDAVAKVVDYMGVNGDVNIKDQFINTVLNCHNGRIAQATSQSNDFYDTPEALIRAIHKPDSINLSLSRHALSETPERALTRMIYAGAKVILSSATAANQSALRNFNLDWKPVAEHIYEPTQHAKDLEKAYSKECDAFSHLVNIQIQKTPHLPISIDNYVKSALSGCDFVDEFADFCVQNARENANDFYNALRLACFIIHQHENDVVSNLCFTNKFIYNGTIDWKVLMFLKRIYSDMELFIVNSKNIEQETKRFADSVRYGKMSFFITPYATSEKGLNITIPHEFGSSDLVYVNRGREPKLFYKDNDKYCSVDIEGVYLTKPTHVCGSMDLSEGDYRQNRIQQSLVHAYHAGDMYHRGHISKSQYDAFMMNILKCDKYPFKKNRAVNYEPDKNMSVIAKVLSMVTQAVGRVCRSNMQINHCNIMFDSAFCEMFDDVDLADYYSDDELAVMPFKVRAALERLCDKSEWLGISRRSSTNIDPSEKIKSANKKEVESITTAVKDIQVGEWKSYEDMNKKIIAFTITKEEYDSLPPHIQTLYVRLKRRMDGTYMTEYRHGYSYEVVCQDEIGNVEVERVYPLDAKSRKVSVAALRIPHTQKRTLIDRGFSLDDSKEYILLPNGFLKLQGNIGEALGDEFLKCLTGLKLSPLENNLYEVMDGVENRESYILAVDFKYFGEGSAMYDDYEQHRADYVRKLSKIRDQFDKPVFAIELNASVIDSQIGMVPNANSIHTLDGDIQVMTVPSIYDDNNEFDYDVAQAIKAAISRFEQSIATAI